MPRITYNFYCDYMQKLHMVVLHNKNHKSHRRNHT